MSIGCIWGEGTGRRRSKKSLYLLTIGRLYLWQGSLSHKWCQVNALWRQGSIVCTTLYSLPPENLPVRARVVNRTFLQFWKPIIPPSIWTFYQISNGIVKPKKDVVFRVSDYGVVWHRWLMELVKPTLQPLMCVVTHWILKWILRQSIL